MVSTNVRNFLELLDCNQVFSDRAESFDDVISSPFELNHCESKYYDTNSFSNYLPPTILNSHDFLLHLNIQGLAPKFDEFKIFLSNLCSQPKLPSVIALTETFLNGFNYTDYNLAGYKPPISDYRKDNSSRGGVSIFIRDDFDYIERPDLNLFIPTIFESVFITLKPSDLTIGVIYRTPDSNYREFLSHYQKTLTLLNQSNKPFILLGDFNFNLLNYNRVHSISEFLDTTFEHGCLPVITKPTRVGPNSASCIDNIITSKVFSDSFSGIFIDDVSDHFPIFYCFPNNSPRNFNTQPNNPPLNYNLSKNNIKSLQEKLELQDWSEILNEDDPSTASTLLNNVISDLLDKTCVSNHKKIIKKQIRNQPWFTPGLKTSLKRKKALYKKSLKQPSLTQHYRNYRNLYNKVVRRAKQMYYSKSLSEAQKDMKKTWSILKEIILKSKPNQPGVEKLNLTQTDSFRLTLNDPLLIAEHLNNYFSSTGSRISSSIPAQEFEPLDFMSDIFVNDSFFIVPTDKKEVIESALSVEDQYWLR